MTIVTGLVTEDMYAMRRQDRHIRLCRHTRLYHGGKGCRLVKTSRDLYDPGRFTL